MSRARRLLTALAAVGLLAGCATGRDEPRDARPSLVERALEHESWVRVQPWERDLLSLEEMAWSPDPLLALRRGHVYFSRESSLGGGSAGGGGCGCN